MDYQGRTILLVEDEAIIALSEQQMLERHGFCVRKAHSGSAAVAEIDAGAEIDLVLMDIDLGPKSMDGTEAARRILEMRTLPVVFLSSHTEPEIVEKAEGVTSYGYIVKHSSETVIIGSLKMAFRLADAHAREEEQARALAANEERYRSLYMNAPLPYQSLDDSGAFLDVNPAWLKTLGYSREELIGHNFAEFLHPEFRDQFRNAFPEFKRRGAIHGIRFRLRHKSGEYRLVQFEGCIGYEPDGSVRQTYCVFKDITEDHAEARRDRAYKLALDSSEDLVAAVDREYRYLFANSTFLQRHGLREEELVGASARDILGAETFAERVRPHLDRALGGETVAFDLPMDYGNGETRTMRVCYYPLRSDRHNNGESAIQGVVSHIRDITDQRAIRQELRRLNSEKDELLRELKHRVKNNLSMVSSLIGLKDAELGDVAELSDLQSQVDAIRSVYEKLLNADDVSHIKLPHYLEEVVRSTLSLHSVGNVSLDLQIEDVQLPAKIASTLGLIVTELATNAMKHGLQAGGDAKFSLSFSLQESRQEYVLEVRNSGPAIPGDVSFSRPMSLGLQLIAGLVQQFDGALRVDRGPDPCFTISFPADRDPTEHKESSHTVGADLQ